MKQTFRFLMLMTLPMVLGLSSCTSDEDDERIVCSTPLRSIITGMDYGDVVFVVGHKSPDCDAVCSAITYAELLQRLGINAEARVAGKVICEPLHVLQEAGIETPPVLENATGLNMIMTDHSEYAQAVDGMEQARVLHVIDHHGTGTVTTAHPLLYYALPIGSTCTIIASMYEEMGETPTLTQARLMLSGLLSDTDNLTSATTTDTDRKFYSWLLERSDIADIASYYAGMNKARSSFDGMTDEEILHSDYKEYEIEGVKIGIGSVLASEDLGLEELCQRMRGVMPAVREQHGLDMLFMMLGDRQANLTHVPFCGEGAKEVAEVAFKTAASEEGCIVTTYISSRKAQFVPAITDGIRQTLADNTRRIPFTCEGGFIDTDISETSSTTPSPSHQNTMFSWSQATAARNIRHTKTLSTWVRSIVVSRGSTASASLGTSPSGPLNGGSRIIINMM